MIGPRFDFPLHPLGKPTILAGFALSAVRPLIGELVSVEVLGRVEHAPRFETKHVQSLRCQLVGSNAAGSS